jgi:cytochrome c oxidase subunit 3
VSSHTLEEHGTHAHADEYSHAHQFDDPAQQKEAAGLGMWAFLATEILFFGALFMIYVFGRFRYNEMWDAASHMLDWKLGALNTVILLVSSFTMALAVWSAQTGQRKKITLFLTLTILLACGFLVVKAFEYNHKYEDHLIPGAGFQVPAEVWHEAGGGEYVLEQGPYEPGDLRQITPKPALGHGEVHEGEQETIARPPLSPIPAENVNDSVGVRNIQYFFALYFLMTGLHGIHVVVGIGLIAVLIFLNQRGWFSASYHNPVEIVGLYWHFVDIVWVFLYPLLYLMDRAK